MVLCTINWDASHSPFPVEDLFESVNDREIRQVFEGQTQIHLEIKQLHRQLAMILDEQRRYVALITEEVTKKGTAVESGQVRTGGGRWVDAGRGRVFSVSPPSLLPSAGCSQSAAVGLRLVVPAGSPEKPERAEVRDCDSVVVIVESSLVFLDKTCFCFGLFLVTNVQMDFLRKTSEIPAVKPCEIIFNLRPSGSSVSGVWAPDNPAAPSPTHKCV